MLDLRQRMLRLALKMNDHAGRPVDPNQLAAAVYMHDAGMALLPLEVINADSDLSDPHLEQIKEHPKIGFMSNEKGVRLRWDTGNFRKSAF